jgi:hypothetical protein
VVRAPSEFSSTNGSPASITAMQEFVVPKSMPKTLAMPLLWQSLCRVLLNGLSHSLEMDYADYARPRDARRSAMPSRRCVTMAHK